MMMQKKRWFFVPVLVGVIVLLTLVNRRDPPAKSLQSQQAVAVRYITLSAQTFLPKAFGYGTAQPKITWQAIAEISARVIFKHPELKKGAILAKDTILLELDQTDIQLNIAQTEASRQQILAQLSELKVKQQNTENALKIENDVLDLSFKQLQRKQNLLKEGSITPSDVDIEKRTWLQQRQNVQSLKNSLNLIPAETAVLDASLQQQNNKLIQIRRDLSRSKIRLPFQGRISEIRAEQNQYAQKGQLLVAVDNIQSSEVNAEFVMDHFALLIPERFRQLSFLPEAENQQHDSRLDPAKLRKLFNIKANVYFETGAINAKWQAEFTNLSDTIDVQSRTIGVVVTVNDSYKKARPGIKPPLAKGMFCLVELIGQPMLDQYIIPFSALRNENQVYVIGEANQLVVKTVKIKYQQGNLVLLSSGLDSGDKIIVSQLFPAVSGMILIPHADKQLQADIRAQSEDGRSQP